MKAIEAFARLDATAIVGVLLVLATLAAAVVAWRRADMRPVAAALGLMVAATVATFVIWSVVTPPKLGDGPLTGWRRVRLEVSWGRGEAAPTLFLGGRLD